VAKASKVIGTDYEADVPIITCRRASDEYARCAGDAWLHGDKTFDYALRRAVK
jgi:hypothetical protein